MYNSHDIANLIFLLANKKNITVGKMLKEIGLTHSTVDKMKRGHMLSADKLLIIAQYFGVSMEYLLGAIDNPNQPSNEYILTDALHDKISVLSSKKREEAENYIDFLLSQEKDTLIKPKVSEIMNEKGDKPMVSEIMKESKKGERKIAAYGGGVQNLKPKEGLLNVSDIQKNVKIKSEK